MDDWLDDASYDVIIVGTGLTETVAAAALARSGRKVLHLDALPFYGEPYSTHSLPALREWMREMACDHETLLGPDADARVSSAPVDEEAVEVARRVAEWEEVEEDKLGRPVVHDGVMRGRAPRVKAVAAIPCPKTYCRVSFEEALPAVRAPGETQAPSGEGEGVQCGSEEAAGGSTDDDAAARAEDVTEGYDDLVSANNGYRYNIDVAPKINLSMGPLIKALLKSGVGRYLEFMPLKHTFLHQSAESKGAARPHDRAGAGAGAERRGCGGSLQRVPMSKADIFQAKTLTPIEKRLLMKFMQWCVVQGGVTEASTGGWQIAGIGSSESEQLGFQRAVGHVGAAAGRGAGAAEAGGGADERAALEGRSLTQVMQEHKLTDKLQRFVLYGIVMGGPHTPALQAIERINCYTQSLGRYSESAFLCNYYGTAEIPQAFSRMCAVYGGTYVLRRGPARFLFAGADGKGPAAGIICSRGQILRAPVVITSGAYLHPQALASALPRSSDTRAAQCGVWGGEEGCLSRAVCVASGPVVDADGLCLAILPPGAVELRSCWHARSRQ